jgi:hypothetical protein
MRESRSSGSVEGVMGDHDSYSDWLVVIPPGLLMQDGGPVTMCIRGAATAVLKSSRKKGEGHSAQRTTPPREMMLRLSA